MFNPEKKIVLKDKILHKLNNQLDGFICPNDTEFMDEDVKELFEAIDELILEGILRKRDCDGLAYEYNK